MVFDLPLQGPVTQAVAHLSLRAAHLGGAHVLGAMELSLHPGETVAIHGPSGAGKTTLLRILAGLEARFDGTRRVAPRMALMFQEPTLLPWRRARDNLTITTACSAAEADALLAEVGLAGKETTFPNRLSLGQQRRLSLARAMALRPDVLLLDEPFVSLDPALVAEMVALVAEVQNRRNMATLLVTHARSEARALADRILTLGGSPAQIVDEIANTPQARLRTIPRAGS